MTDVARIVATLSEAQKRLLSILPEDPAKAVRFWNGDYRAYRGALQTWRVLARKGLATSFGGLTERGLAVRARLEQDG